MANLTSHNKNKSFVIGIGIFFALALAGGIIFVIVNEAAKKPMLIDEGKYNFVVNVSDKENSGWIVAVK